MNGYGVTTAEIFPKYSNTTYDLSTIVVQVEVDGRFPGFSGTPLVSEIAAAFSAIDLPGPDDLNNIAQFHFSTTDAVLGDPTTLHFAGTVTNVTTGPLPASLVLTLGALGLSNLLSISRGRSRRY